MTRSGDGARRALVKLGTAGSLVALCALSVGALVDVSQTRLAPSAPAPDLRFGNAVAVSGDTAVIGAAWSEAGTASAYVFARRDGAWIEEARLEPVPEANGSDLTIAVDGDTILLSDYTEGAADVFVREAGTWSYQGQLDPLPLDDYGDCQFAISGDTAVVSAPDGGVHVFLRTATGWDEGKLLEPAGQDEGARPVAISGDLLAIGSRSASEGEVHLYARSGGTWSPEATLTGSAEEDPLRGPVALSGETLLAGASEGPYVFGRSGGVWTEQARLVPSFLATEVAALSGDTAVVPEVVYSNGGSDASSSLVIAIYTRTLDRWTLENEIVVGERSYGSQTPPVALSGDTMIVGSPVEDSQYTGAAYAVVLAEGPAEVRCAYGAGGGPAPWGSVVAAMSAALAMALRRRRSVAVDGAEDKAP